MRNVLKEVLLRYVSATGSVNLSSTDPKEAVPATKRIQETEEAVTRRSRNATGSQTRMHVGMACSWLFACI